jgi:hypothetical protein
MAHDQHSDPGVLNESAKETFEADSFLLTSSIPLKPRIGGCPRSHSNFAQSTTDGTEHKGLVDIDATMPEFSLRYRG